MSRQPEAQVQPVPNQGGHSRASTPDRRAAESFLLWPAAAFWTGATILFLGAAGAAGWQFMGGILRSRGAPGTLAPIYIVWLLLALFFLSSGLISAGLAWLLARRRVLGYYGSLLAALVMLFLGPLVSIIPTEPDYLITATLALLPAIVILLTLGSGAAFDRR